MRKFEMELRSRMGVPYPVRVEYDEMGKEDVIRVFAEDTIEVSHVLSPEQRKAVLDAVGLDWLTLHDSTKQKRSTEKKETIQ